jgi:hypothetical protein
MEERSKRELTGEAGLLYYRQAVRQPRYWSPSLENNGRGGCGRGR